MFCDAVSSTMRRQKDNFRTTIGNETANGENIVDNEIKLLHESF